MNKYKTASILISAVVVLVVAIGIVQIIQQSENAREKAISQEFVLCVSAICIEGKSGFKCSEIKSSIAHVILTDDANTRGAQRILVKPTDKQCGISNFD